jgi:threonine 3-dehydrogenase
LSYRELYGANNVVLSDIVRPSDELLAEGTYRYADVMDIKQVQELLVNNQIDWLIHLSALLSAIGRSFDFHRSVYYLYILGERDVPLAMKLNIEGTHHILELARKYKCRLFIPSTIGTLFHSIDSH